MTMIAITIIISISVNAARRLDIGLLVTPLPFRIGSSIGCLVFGFGIDIKDILAAPGHTRRVVLHAADTPLPRVGHGIERDTPQKLELGIGRLAGALHAVHQRFQRFGIAEAVGLLYPQLSGI